MNKFLAIFTHYSAEKPAKHKLIISKFIYFAIFLAHKHKKPVPKHWFFVWYVKTPNELFNCFTHPAQRQI